MSAWKTMESIPDTGELVLMALRNGDIIIAPAMPPVEATRDQRLKMHQASGEWPSADFIPSHWMPLPAPPQPGESNARILAVPEQETK